LLLSDKLQNIEDAIEAKLEEYDFSYEVRNIVFGERERINNVTPPTIWVFFDESNIETVSGFAEQWTMPIVVAATYKSRNIKESRQRAEELASEASHAVMSGQQKLNGAVRLVKRTRFLPGTTRIQDQETIYGAGFGLELTFRWCLTKEG